MPECQVTPATLDLLHRRAQEFQPEAEIGVRDPITAVLRGPRGEGKFRRDHPFLGEKTERPLERGSSDSAGGAGDVREGPLTAADHRQNSAGLRLLREFGRERALRRHQQGRYRIAERRPEKVPHPGAVRPLRADQLGVGEVASRLGGIGRIPRGTRSGALPVTIAVDLADPVLDLGAGETLLLVPAGPAHPGPPPRPPRACRRHPGRSLHRRGHHRARRRRLGGRRDAAGRPSGAARRRRRAAPPRPAAPGDRARCGSTTSSGCGTPPSPASRAGSTSRSRPPATSCTP